VAGNVKNNGIIEPGAPEYYEVWKHSPQEAGRGGTAIVRTAIDARQVAGWVRGELAAIDPGLPVKIGMLDQQVSKLAARPRFNAVLLGIFAALGLALAGIGIYGLISFMVVQRTQEIGVRMALGATPGGIVRLVLRHASGWTAAGAAVGSAGALFLTRLLESMLFGVSSNDPWTLAAAVSVLVIAALAAAWIPARHAARVDPVKALQRE
jgi:ABC-type antimicrobial peptide transport system permease subunit